MPATPSSPAVFGLPSAASKKTTNAVLRQIAYGSWASPSTATFGATPQQGSMIVAVGATEAVNGSLPSLSSTGIDWYPLYNTYQTSGAYQMSAVQIGIVSSPTAGVSTSLTWTGTMALGLAEFTGLLGAWTLVTYGTSLGSTTFTPPAGSAVFTVCSVRDSPPTAPSGFTTILAYGPPAGGQPYEFRLAWCPSSSASSRTVSWSYGGVPLIGIFALR